MGAEVANIGGKSNIGIGGTGAFQSGARRRPIRAWRNLDARAKCRHFPSGFWLAIPVLKPYNGDSFVDTKERSKCASCESV